MPLITNEADEKRESSFLKYEEDNVLVLKSNLYRLASHYLKAQNKYVICKLLDNCYFCKKDIPVVLQFNYWVDLNGKEGLLDIKASVFYAINNIERASKKDKRDVSWLVIKSGSGLDTRYTVSKNENLEDKITEEVLEGNNKKLSDVMKTQENTLEVQYKELSNVVEDEADDEVKPEDIPF